MVAVAQYCAVLQQYDKGVVHGTPSWKQPQVLAGTVHKIIGVGGRRCSALHRLFFV
jgi:hypothetical protein